MEPLSWWVWRRSKDLDSVQAALAGVAMQRLARVVVTWAQPYDAILCPTLAETPVPIGTIDPLGPDPAATFARGAAFTPFTAISNVTGSPAISLPLAEHPAGLPLGVQLIGRPAGEGPLLALASQLEAARPWSGGCVQSVVPKTTGAEKPQWPT
jgi:amidase